MRLTRWRRHLLWLGVFALIVAACGDDDGGTDTTAAGGSTTTEADEMLTLRFVFSPDPVWNWLEDEGIIDEMEAEAGVHIDRNESEDEFAFFAGGHADIVSTGSYETPVLEAETGVQTVTIGQYNMAKDIIVVEAGSGYTTFDDLEDGCAVGVESFSGSTIVWIALADELHGRTLGEQPDDLQMAITDFNLAPELVVSGDLCAGVTSIYNTASYLMNGSVEGLYDLESASQIYGRDFVAGHEGMNSNNFVTTKSWYEEHPKEVAFFLEVWDRGLEEWRTNRDAIMRAYPDDFGWKTEEELQFIKDWYVNNFDEFVQTVYLDEEWIEGESQITQLLIDGNVIPEGSAVPIHVCIDPATGEETCRLPSS